MDEAGPAESMGAYRLGIDLGTTFTAAAIRRGEIARMATLGVRQPEIPSVVAIADDEILVGDAAERRALVDPGSIAREFKRRIGDPTPLIVGSTPWSAEALTGRLLAHVLDHVKTAEGDAPAHVTITHPANWHQYKLDHLRQALLLAGCEDAELVAEPVAAAQYYASQGRISPGQRLAVFDFGGGTLDTAVVHATSRRTFDLIGQPKGLERLGGVDLDYALFVHVLSVLDIDLDELDDTRANRQAVSRLRSDCRDAKEHLSVDTATAIPIMLPTAHTEVRINRAEFERMIRQRLADATNVMATTIHDAGLQISDIDGVLLVGGTSRIPIVSQVIGEDLQLPVLADAHPKHSIALGATLTRKEADSVPTAPPHDHPPRDVVTAAESMVDAGREQNDETVVAGEATSLGVREGEQGRSPSVDASIEVRDQDDSDPVRRQLDREALQSRWSRSRWALAAVLSLVVLAASALALALVGGDETSPPQAADRAGATSVVPAADGSDPVSGPISVGARPGTPLYADGAVWVPNRFGSTLSRIDAATAGVVETIEVGSRPGTPVFAEGAIWVPNWGSRSVTRIDVASGRIDTVDVDSNPETPVFAEGAIWVPNAGSGTVSRVDAATAVVTPVIVGGNPGTPLFAEGVVWVPNRSSGTVTGIVADTGVLFNTIAVGESPGTPVFAEGGVWVPNEGSGTVSRINTVNSQVDTIAVGESPGTPVFAEGGVWVPNEGGGTVSRIDVVSGEVTTVGVGESPGTPVFAEGALWIPNRGSDTVSRIGLELG